MRSKRILAVVMSLCIVTGAAAYGTPAIAHNITAQAADSVEGSWYSFDATTGVLTLRGEVDRDELYKFRKTNAPSVQSIIAEEGTILPENCKSLFENVQCTSIDLSKADTSNVTDMHSMFKRCYGLTKLDVSGFDTSNVTDMNSMFYGCRNLTELDVSGFDTSNVTDMSGMFWECRTLTKLDVSKFDTKNVCHISGMFNSCNSLTELDVSRFDTSKVAKTTYMFSGCGSLTELDVSNFDTSNVTDISSMFSSCRNLTELDVSGFDTSNVTDMSGMFSLCENLTELDVSGFDTGKAKYMYLMFNRCENLTELDVSGFDTSKATNLLYMFNRCEKLTELDVSGFDTSNVTYMHHMFSDCDALTKLDLSGFDTSNVTNMDDMFTGCENLNTLILGENFKSINEEVKLSNGRGWVNAERPSVIVSGIGEYAVIENDGRNTYKQYRATTYPTNINVAYSEKYHQFRIQWSEVEGAENYGVAVYSAGKWKVANQNIPATTTTFTSPKLIPGHKYTVAVCAKVNGKWETDKIEKRAVTVTVI